MGAALRSRTAAKWENHWQAAVIQYNVSVHRLAVTSQIRTPCPGTSRRTSRRLGYHYYKVPTLSRSLACFYLDRSCIRTLTVGS